MIVTLDKHGYVIRNEWQLKLFIRLIEINNTGIAYMLYGLEYQGYFIDTIGG